MHPISLQDMARMAEGMLLAGDPAATIRSVHFDTRQLETESLFVPIRGEARDGHDFLLAAAERGARAALVSDQAKIPEGLPDGFGLVLVNDTLRAFQKLAAAYRRQFAIPFVAVTGSNGKTTTKDLIAHLLESKLSVYKTYKNFNNHIGVPYSLMQIEESHRAAVLELGMNHAGEIDLLASLVKPEISVITHIGDAHIEFFGTREKIALAKAELLPHTAPHGLVLLNGDNPYLRRVAHLYPGEICFYSTEGPADVWAQQVTTDENGSHFTVCFRSGESFAVSLPLFGKHNVANALPAIAVARRLGLSPAEIASALKTASISAMRFEVTRSPGGCLVVNDAYNASPSSMKAAIETFAGIFPQRQKVLVLGDMFELGTDSKEWHADVGRFADRFRDHFQLLVTVGTDSRALHEAYGGAKRHFDTKEAAVETLAALFDSEHAMLFKASRGMKLETLLAALLG